MLGPLARDGIISDCLKHRGVCIESKPAPTGLVPAGQPLIIGRFKPCSLYSGRLAGSS